MRPSPDNLFKNSRTQNRMNLPSGMAEGLDVLCADVRRLVVEAESGTPSIDDMVRTYYAVSNFATAMGMLKRGGAAGGAKPPDAMLEVGELVSGRFDGVIHPRFKKAIYDMIRSDVEELQSRQDPPPRQQPSRGRPVGTARTGRAPGAESAKYDRLRSLMSIREFVEQYDAMVAARDRGGDPDGGRDGNGRHSGDPVQPRKG